MITIEQARTAAQTDRVIDLAADLVEAAGSYTAALLALAGDAAARGGAEQAAAIETAAGACSRVEDDAARRLDLWEDNAGGLCLVDRAAGKGWRGFEAGQNLRAHRVTPRTEFTLASDAPDFDSLGDGSAYSAMDEEAIEALYEHASDHRDAPRMVASWERGAVTVHPGSIGAAARWYLASDAVD